jgi:hypothetical protein
VTAAEARRPAAAVGKLAVAEHQPGDERDPDYQLEDV